MTTTHNKDIPNINILKVTINDLQQLQEIGRKTFYETFSGSNTEENMRAYLDEGFSDSKLISELNETDSEFYFAKLGEIVIGYLKLNSGLAQTELKEEKSVEIERIYVLKEYHGKNVGQLLCEKAIQIAKRKNVLYVWLGVWEENPRAINFYKKNDFIEFDKHIFKLGNDKQIDVLMKRFV
jgi:diamine N-acetyltransferase